MVDLLLVFKGISILFSTVAASVYIPTSRAGGFLFLYTLSSIFFLDFFFFFMMAMLTGVGWIFFIVLIYISLIISNAEHLFMCLLAICMSSLDKCLFWSSAPFCPFFFFWLDHLFFWYWAIWAAYIFWKLILGQLLGLQLFLPILRGCVFILFTVSFAV